MENDLLEAMKAAIARAEEFAGATSPNPPVGAVALDETGKIIASAAHERAGEPHAEAALISLCEAQGLLQRVHTLVVTLEPCNHQGRTGPCTEAILKSGIKRVAFGATDPNPKVAGNGAARGFPLTRDASLA